MGRAPCCDKGKVKRGPWSPEEDNTLKTFLEKHGIAGNWIALPRKAGLNRCGKSCRLRWLNYLRPDIKHGGFSEEEDSVILTLYNNIGSRWSIIASHLPGRTDNDVKNYWNTKLKKKLLLPSTSSSSSSSTNKMTSSTENPNRLSGTSTVAKIEAPDHHDRVLNVSSWPLNLPNAMVQNQDQLLEAMMMSSFDQSTFSNDSCHRDHDHDHISDHNQFGNNTQVVSTSTDHDHLSSSSTTTTLGSVFDHREYHNSHNGIFMDCYTMGMGFDSSNYNTSDVFFSGFGF